MKKKFILGLLYSILIIFSYSFVLATDTTTDIQEDTFNAINSIENTTQNIVNNTEDTINSMNESTQNMINNEKEMISNTINSTESYTATLTSSTEDIFMGMNASTWTWIILGIAIVSIIGIVWYYASQISNNNYNESE